MELVWDLPRNLKKHLPGVAKECFLEALKYLKSSKKHPFETPGDYLFFKVFVFVESVFTLACFSCSFLCFMGFCSGYNNCKTRRKADERGPGYKPMERPIWL